MRRRADTSRLGLLDILVAAVLFVTSMSVYASSSTRFLELRDEGHILELSRRLADGEIPHRDTNDVYGPGVFAVTGAALYAGDNRIMSVRWTLAAMRAGAVVLSFLLARFLVPVPFALLVAIVSMIYWGRTSWNLNVPYASVYTIPLCMLSCFALVEALRRDSRRGYFLTGLAAGLAILFKQTLGILNVYVLVLALWAAAATRDTRRDVSGAALWLATVGTAAVAAGCGLLPFLPYMNWTDYFVHFAPMHALLALVATAGLVRGEAPDLARLIVRVGVPFAAGVVLFPALVLALYAYWGSVDRLLYNMFVLPTRYQDYYSSIAAPPRALSYAVLAVGSAVTAGLLLAAGRRRTAAVAAAVSGVALLAASWRFGPVGLATWDAGQWTGVLDMFGGVHLVVLGYAAVAAVATRIFSREAEEPEARTGTAVLVAAILFLQSSAFTIFPSAGYNVFLIQGAIAPLLGYVLWSWYRAALGPATSRLRRALGFALILVLPAWMTGTVLARTASTLWRTEDRIPVGLDVAEGIALDPEMHRAFHVTELEQLVGWLRQNTSPQTRLLLMTNEEMILFASDRRHALPDYHFYLFISAWGLMHGEQAVPRDLPSIVDQLDHFRGEILVIDRPDATSANVRRYFPQLAEYVDRRFELAQSIGEYRVLRRVSPAPEQ